MENFNLKDNILKLRELKKEQELLQKKTYKIIETIKTPLDIIGVQLNLSDNAVYGKCEDLEALRFFKYTFPAENKKQKIKKGNLIQINNSNYFIKIDNSYPQNEYNVFVSWFSNGLEIRVKLNIKNYDYSSYNVVSSELTEIEKDFYLNYNSPKNPISTLIKPVYSFKNFNCLEVSGCQKAYFCGFENKEDYEKLIFDGFY